MPKLRLAFLTLGLVLVVGLSAYLTFRNSPSLKERARRVLRRDRKFSPVRCEVVHPTTGGLDRTAVQPGTVTAYESVDLYAEASGYLKEQSVDIGDVVKKGTLLAVVDVPDLETHLEKAKASHAQAQAHVGQMNAAVSRARADAKAAKALIPQAKAALGTAQARTRLRQMEYERQYKLFKQEALNQQLVDEADERRLVAREAENTAKAAVDTAVAQEEAARAKIEQAEADVAEAEAQVKVAQAEIDRVTVQLRFAKVYAPFPGVITKRTLFPGGYVRSAREGERTPLLSIDRTDKVRVVVQVPDREAPYADKGDPAVVEVDALDGKTFNGYISRTQASQDTLTRTMRIEIDLDNPKGELRPGMYGKVTILLQKAANVLSLPCGCLVGATKEGQGQVYCVRDGKAVLVPVRVGMDNGVRVEVISGVTAADTVVRRFSGSLATGAPVTVSEIGNGNFDAAKNH
jgi:RND family efflux transporter MFP subunit